MKILILLILLPIQTLAQDISGVWTGFLYTSGAGSSQVPYELVISESNGKFTGYSLTVFTFNGVENTGIKSMKIKSRKGGITVEDDKLIYNNYTTAGRRVTLIGTFSILHEDSVQILEGTFVTRSVDRSSFTGTIRLQKKADHSASRLMAQLEKLNLLADLSLVTPSRDERKKELNPTAATNTGSLARDSLSDRQETIIAVSKDKTNLPVASIPDQKKKMPGIVDRPVVKPTSVTTSSLVAAELNSRKTEVLRSIYFQSDSLILTLYDNGEVDGDTVSVLVNDRIIIARQGLTTMAKNTILYTNPGSGDSLRLIMYAENLGKIPPNTGLLVIQDGDEKYQIRFEGDYQKNSAVILRRKK